YSSICEHWREPRNAEWRPRVQFFNTLLRQIILPRLFVAIEQHPNRRTQSPSRRHVRGPLAPARNVNVSTLSAF
ncbi:MAG TPA: hypothetical protein PKV75_12210, partial [Desulfobacterales bacterium]|nr:hypothetical protein [Desulfobacterales bacterium]